MRNIIIGDEHCRGKFYNIYNKVKDSKDIQNIICVGDYFDPYERKELDEKISNFNSIIEIARKDSRVKLLLGNHDVHYLINTFEKSRMDIFNAKDISKKIFDNIDLFNLLIELNNDTIVSHAGVSPVWMKTYEFSNIEDVNNVLKYLACDEKYLNAKIKKQISGLQYQKYYDYSGCGDEEHQPPTWIRPCALIKTEKQWKYKTQIIGHTRTDVPETKDYFFNEMIVEGFEQLVFDGNIKTIQIKNTNKKIIMVDTGDNLETYLEY